MRWPVKAFGEPMTRSVERHRARAATVAWLLGSLTLTQAGAALPGTVGEALDRPAASARGPERSVLLAAARAGSRLIAVGERGIVLLSDDEGGTWRQVSTPVSVTLTAVRFADRDNGYAVGHGGVVLRTGDGGLTWHRSLDGRKIAKVMLAAATAVADAKAVQSAQRLATDGPDKPLLDILIFDSQRALVVGAFGLALLTEDGGTTWSTWRDRLDNPKELHLYTVRQRGNRVVIAGEQGLVLQSSDSGKSFKRLATPYNGSFFTAELPDDDGIIVAGLRGKVWRSPDVGATWMQLSSPVEASITASAVGSDGRLLFSNQAGMVLALRDDKLQPVGSRTLGPLNFLLPMDTRRVLALSVQGVDRVDLQAADPAPQKKSQ